MNTGAPHPVEQHAAPGESSGAHPELDLIPDGVLANGVMSLALADVARLKRENADLRSDLSRMREAIYQASGMRSNDLPSDIESLIRVFRQTQADLSRLREERDRLQEELQELHTRTASTRLTPEPDATAGKG